MHFVITFGFSIPIDSNTNVKSHESAYENVVVNRKSWHRKENAIDTRDESANSKKRIINVNKILAEIHIEYELLTGYTFKLDCRCWETATKIYTENGDKCLKTISCPITENELWVIFSVHHLVHLNDLQLEKLFNWTITYTMFFGKQKFSERVKKDKVKGFYVEDESIKVEPYNFLELYPLDYRKSSYNINTSTEELPKSVTVIDETYGDFSIVTYVDAVPDGIHERKFRKMLKKNRFPSQTSNFDSFIMSNEVEQQSTLKKSKESTKSKPSKNGKTKMQKQEKGIIHKINILSETLFADMGAITCFDKTPDIPNLSSVLVYTQCEGILSVKQMRMNLNPISIKLEQLSNFPDHIVRENGFKHLYAKIMFVDHVISTPYYEAANTINFEIVKCFLCKELQAEKLISFLTTKFLTIEVIGVRYTDVSHDIYQESEPEESEPFMREEMLFGTAEFDLSDLLKGIWEVRLMSNLSRSRGINCTSINKEGATNSTKLLPVLTSDILISSGTLVKIKVRLAYDLRTLHQDVLSRSDIFNRIFVILNNFNLVNEILESITAYNNCFQNMEQCEEQSLQEQDITRHILTGFAIDCCDKVYIFVEGLANGHLLQIWEMIANIPAHDASVYYNSSCVFLTRLYEDFLFFGGIVKIKLDNSLETHLREKRLYVSKTGMTFESKVLRTMGLMELTSTMQSLCQSRLFPDSISVQGLVNDVKQLYNL